MSSLVAASLFMNNLSNQPVTPHNQNLITLMEWFLFEDTNIRSGPAANGLIWLFRSSRIQNEGIRSEPFQRLSVYEGQELEIKFLN